MKKHALGYTIQIAILTIVIAIIAIVAIIVTGGVVYTEVIVGISLWSYFLSSVFHLFVFFQNDYPPLIFKGKEKQASE